MTHPAKKLTRWTVRSRTWGSPTCSRRSLSINPNFFDARSRYSYFQINKTTHSPRIPRLISVYQGYSHNTIFLPIIQCSQTTPILRLLRDFQSQIIEATSVLRLLFTETTSIPIYYRDYCFKITDCSQPKN